MKKLRLMRAYLNLFDEGTADTAGGGAARAIGMISEKQALSPKQESGRNRIAGGLGGVIYGKQAQSAASDLAENNPDAGEEGTKTLTTDERRARFRELVSADYKDIYQTEIQRVIDRRFKETKTLQESLLAQKPIIDSLMERHGITDGDLAKLKKALSGDNSYRTGVAVESEASHERSKSTQGLFEKNAELQVREKLAMGERAAGEQLAKWANEALAARQSYPALDMKAEMQNPRFASMLRSGVPIRHAYEVVHLSDIKQSVARHTAKKTERNVIEGIRSKGSRPAENGVTNQSGVIVRSDVSKLTRADRAEILRRVARGEKISF